MFKKPAASTPALVDRVKKVAEVKPALPAAIMDRPAASFGAKRPQREERRAMFRNAALVFGSQRVVVAITNLSETGACVEFPPQPTLPPSVTLVALGFKREARVVWVKQGAAGLHFLD